MKHTWKITLILVGLFLLAQIIGLEITDSYISKSKSLPYNIERPQFEEKTSYIPIFIIILIATGLAILLARFKAARMWKLWFFLSVWFTLLIAFSAFTYQFLALIIALLLAMYKAFRPNVFLHNFSELFIYGGLAAIFVPILSLWSISILLILISIYDAIAVWKTKHMISLAKFQSKVKVFAGLLIPYGKKNTAILGGGDIGFTLLFSGVVLKESNFLNALVVATTVSIALLLLLMLSKKNRFYPAMPFLTVGCFLGYVLTLLL